jgi:hypothetical protein
MTRQSVDSSMITSIGYDAGAETLEIEFTQGSIYLYQGVEPDVYRDLMDAPSAGRAFNESVKGRYASEKVG